MPTKESCPSDSKGSHVEVWKLAKLLQHLHHLRGSNGEMLQTDGTPSRFSCTASGMNHTKTVWLINGIIVVDHDYDSSYHPKLKQS